MFRDSFVVSCFSFWIVGLVNIIESSACRFRVRKVSFYFSFKLSIGDIIYLYTEVRYFERPICDY